MTYRGDNPCDVLLIGEAPGRSEDMLGDPFVGEAGHYLKGVVDVAFKQHARAVHQDEFGEELPKNKYDFCFEDSGGELAYAKGCDKTIYTREHDFQAEDYISKVHEKFPTLRVGYSNICCCLPLGEPEVVGGQRPIRPPEKPEAEACRPRLLELINIVRPKAIVTLGKVPTRFLPKVKDGLPACVQFVEETIHPAALLRMQNDNPIRYKESRNRCLLTLTRVKYRLWGID